MKDAYLKTPSGLAVRMPYSAVVMKFGEATRTKVDEDGRKMYIYDVYHGVQDMVFYVDDSEVITEICVVTEI